MATNSGPLADAQVAQLEVLPDYEVTHSPEVGKLFGALAKAQLSFKAVVKQTDNAAFMRGGRASKYADLAEYIDATQKALAENGLVVTQWPDVSPEAKSMTLVTILGHESGEWMRGKLTLPATGRDGFTPQTCGSSITYARRYSYAAITGCASEDDDGNAASGRGSAQAAQDVAQEKIKAHEEAKKARERVGDVAVPCLFYVWHEESKTAEITGADEILKAQRDVLKSLWNKTANAIVADANQLEDLKFTFQERGVLFRPLQSA